MTMNAVLATIDDSKQARIWLNIEVDINLLISTLFYWTDVNPLVATLEQTCARPPTPQAAWIEQTHIAGGPGGFATMVMMFVNSWCVLCGLMNCDS